MSDIHNCFSTRTSLVLDNLSEQEVATVVDAIDTAGRQLFPILQGRIRPKCLANISILPKTSRIWKHGYQLGLLTFENLRRRSLDVLFVSKECGYGIFALKKI